MVLAFLLLQLCRLVGHGPLGVGGQREAERLLRGLGLSSRRRDGGEQPQCGLFGGFEDFGRGAS
ncbi:hypothetical protein [Streptomyces candidus]|uniref:Uncharacterized protein n=1 Tax=Streptomyces candidus TaxID=67283 RepID=A0A7X0HPG9_9ACTN|nr:hypothetical protein [Streptomyces candidus]MBB6439928.1 hypothetical protein [Streptomyces candidus]